MNHTGDPIEFVRRCNKLDEHKYLNRFQELSARIDVWRQVGPACTEEEWNEAEAALEHANEVVRLISANPEYKVPAYRLKKANAHWKLYSKESKVLKWNFTTHSICQE